MSFICLIKQVSLLESCVEEAPLIKPQTVKTILRCVRAKSLRLSLTLWDPMDYSPLGSSIQGILQARILEWAAMSFSRGSYLPRDHTHISLAGGLFTASTSWEALPSLVLATNSILYANCNLNKLNRFFLKNGTCWRFIHSFNKYFFEYLFCARHCLKSRKYSSSHWHKSLPSWSLHFSEQDRRWANM